MTSLTVWQPKSTNQPLPVKTVARLIVRLQARYGTAFTDKFAGVPQDVLAAEWADALAGYTGADLKRGMNACLTLKWPPTLPEFMGLCRPVMDAEVCWQEAVNNLALRERGQSPAWSHPAIYWAAVDVGPYELRRAPWPTIKARWGWALSKQAGRDTWPEVPPPSEPVAALLPAPATKPNPEVRAKLKAQIQAMKFGARRP